jgi:ligand-binding sensor domain-containing protein
MLISAIVIGTVVVFAFSRLTVVGRVTRRDSTRLGAPSPALPVSRCGTRFGGNSTGLFGRRSVPEPRSKVMIAWQLATLAVLGMVGFPSIVSGGWRTINASNGLLDNSVWAMTEDRSGRFWIGTCRGVSCYDGAVFHTFPLPLTSASHWVTDLLEDRTGRLWVTTGGSGVHCFDGSQWTRYRAADGLGNNWVMGVLEDQDGALWFATFGAGAVRYDGVSWTRHTRADGLASDFVMSLVEDKAGDLWFATQDAGGSGGGVSRFSPRDGSWRTFTVSDGLVGDHVTAMLADRSGCLWFGTASGVSRFDPASNTWTTYADLAAQGGVGAIFEDRAGDIWFGTSYGGVTRFDGVRWTTFGPADGLVDVGICSIAQDRAGNLWFGSQTNGLSLYDGSGWTTHILDPGITNVIKALAEDSTGCIWVAHPYGVSMRIDSSWRLLPIDLARCLLVDRSGNVWCGTNGRGVGRYDGDGWTMYTTEDGLGDNYVRAIVEDHAGRLWFAANDERRDTGGVTMFDGTDWTRYDTDAGLAHRSVSCMAEDHEGCFWFGTNYPPGFGASRFNPATGEWRTFTTADGLADDLILSILVDRDGVLWFGTRVGGVTRYDGTSWTTYTMADGLSDAGVSSIFEDSSGNIWFGTLSGGVTRYDGVQWITYTGADGLANNRVDALLEDRRGIMWFGTFDGLSEFAPDRVPPLSVFVLTPGRISPRREIDFSFLAAFGEGSVMFSHRIDGGQWSDWTFLNSHVVEGVCDGGHVFSVRARDRHGNVEQSPAVWTFEVDATPPIPVIISPAFGEVVRDTVSVIGRTDDSRFLEFRVDVRQLGASTWEPPDAAEIAHGMSPVWSGPVAYWPTNLFADGRYELRLSVADSLGLVGTALVEATVDNVPPWATVTSPALVSAERGGDVYTSTGLAHAYFPPRGFGQDAVVTIAALDSSGAPPMLTGGSRRLMPGYEISWGAAGLEKPGTLEILYAGECGDPRERMVLYTAGADSVWSRVGGTDVRSEMTIMAPLASSGRYALYEETDVPDGASTLSALTMTPRVFSPRGRFAAEQVAIGFSLGRDAGVTVRVYNRAGRLVCEVASGRPMNAGANLVRWDGRDQEANQVQDGLYLVVVEALGKKQTKTLAVVR